MTELRLHRELYDGTAIEEAVKTFEKFGGVERKEHPAYWVVQVTAASPAREQKLSRELSNYALGLTVKGKKSS